MWYTSLHDTLFIRPYSGAKVIGSGRLRRFDLHTLLYLNGGRANGRNGEEHG